MNIRMRKVRKDQKNCPWTATMQSLISEAGEPMDEREYLAAKEHIEAECREIVEAAQANRTKKLEALESTWSLFQDIAKKKGTAITAETRPVLSDLVRAVLPTLGDQFKKYHVLKAIESKFPESKGTFLVSTLGGTLTRMRKRGELEIAERGSGPDGFVYRRGK